MLLKGKCPRIHVMEIAGELFDDVREEERKTNIPRRKEEDNAVTRERGNFRMLRSNGYA